MESVNSASSETQTQFKAQQELEPRLSEQWFTERFESILPKIQERWPNLAQQTLEATRGSLDEVIQLISKHSGITTYKVQEQLEELLDSASTRTKDIAQSLEPLEKQLEELLDELNTTLRPKLEGPIRKRPILAIGMAAGIGVILGMLLAGSRRPS